MTTTNIQNKKYPSDISREQFNKIKDILEGARKHTRPRKLDLYDVFNAVLYLLDNGTKWRSLPHEYPKWRSVHEYFSIWSTKREGEKESILEIVLKKNGSFRTYKKWEKARN
jgi:transposase